MGLIVWATAVDVIEVETRGTEVGERVGIVGFLQAAGGIESQVVVDELSQVGVPGADSRILFVIAFGFRRRRAFVGSGHGIAQRGQNGFIELGGGQGTEHSAKTAVELVGASSGLESTELAVASGGGANGSGSRSSCGTCHGSLLQVGKIRIDEWRGICGGGERRGESTHNRPTRGGG